MCPLQYSTNCTDTTDDLIYFTFKTKTFYLKKIYQCQLSRYRPIKVRPDLIHVSLANVVDKLTSQYFFFYFSIHDLACLYKIWSTEKLCL